MIVRIVEWKRQLELTLPVRGYCWNARSVGKIKSTIKLSDLRRPILYYPKTNKPIRGCNRFPSTFVANKQFKQCKVVIFMRVITIGMSPILQNSPNKNPKISKKVQILIPGDLLCKLSFYFREVNSP